MELEIINKLFLELSQVTTATTAKELKARKEIGHLHDQIDTLEDEKVALNIEIDRLNMLLNEGFGRVGGDA